MIVEPSPSCVRCGQRISVGTPCDYHERGCPGTDCRCDTSKVVHRRCCEQCNPPVRAHANPRAI